MLRTTLRFFCIALATSASLSAGAQSFLPKTVQFKGDSEYTDTELTAASNLKKGVALTVAQMNARSKLLSDSGVFASVNFTFNGQDLVVELVPAPMLYPIRLENFPIAQNAELDERLHLTCPLYHGKVPVQGGLLDDIQQKLQDELAVKGIHATIAVTPYTDMKLGKVTAMSFSITDPDVLVGDVHVQGSSAALAAKAQLIVSKATGSNYSSESSKTGIERALATYYSNQGYLEAKIQTTAQPAVSADGSSLRIPFWVSVEEGAQYKLSGVHLSPDMLVPQATFDKIAELRPGDIASQGKLNGSLTFLQSQYHDKGYMHAEITATPTFDPVQQTVAYAIAAQPGTLYSMGRLRVSGVNDELRQAITAALKMPQGATFDEGAIQRIESIHGVNPALGQLFASATLSYVLHLHDDTHTVDVDLSVDRKQ